MKENDRILIKIIIKQKRKIKTEKSQKRFIKGIMHDLKILTSEIIG